ncbi:MAG TPA: RagB/SusD family nutrient uptake outer membrane protein, partial [Mucilaginibacter sp.]
MKKIKYAIIAFTAIVMLYNSGCQKQLDIKPQNTIEADQALKTSKDVEGVLIGAYTAAGLRGFYGGRLQSTTDFLSDDGDFSYYGTFSDYTELNDKKITVNNIFVEGVWDSGFNTIGVCNTVLANLNLVVSTDKARVEGEARFLRGMTYFDLARAFGKAWNDGSP